MADILVFSEVDSVANELATLAREMGNCHVAVLGPGASARAGNPAAYGAVKTYVGEDARLKEFDAEVYSSALGQIVQLSGATLVLLGSTKRGKELAGRLAQKLGCGAITDATGISLVDGALQVQRYALGGNTVSTETITTDRQVVSVMPKTAEATQKPATGATVPVELVLSEPRVKVVERKAKASATANIESAETLVIVGKGFAKKQDLALAEALAGKLKAELACTRTLSADYHWLAEDRMIGISGKKCKPRLLLSVGISGQIQHTVGILGAKLIVAVNKDKGAPIFKIADYGIVGDLYQALPKLTERIG